MASDQELDLVAYSRRLGGAVTVVAALLVTLIATQVGRVLVVHEAARDEEKKIELLRALAPLPPDRLTPGTDQAPLREVLRGWVARGGWSGLVYMGLMRDGPQWAGPPDAPVPARFRSTVDWYVGPQLLEGETPKGSAPLLLAFRADLAPDLSHPEYVIGFRVSDDVDRRLRSFYLVIFSVITGTLGLLYSALISVVGRGEVLRREALARAEVLKRANQEAHAMLVQAAKMTALGELAAGIAHEINNPVAVVRNALEVMAEAQAAHEPEVERGLADIGEAAERIRRIVKDLSTFSAPQATELVAVPLGPLLARTLELARLSTSAREVVELACDVPADLPPVRAMEGPLLQVFLNLIVNARYAVSHRPPDAAHPPARVAVSARVVSPNRVAVEVRDNGAGIPPDLISRIFEPFFTTKPRGEGTGLGLWVSHRIIQSHGGGLQVAAAPGGGTCVTVELLVAPEGNDV